MTELRHDLPPLPIRMRVLPIEERGYPVPWFVAWIDGKPDFRVIDTPKLAIAHNRHVCWLCGQPLGRYLAFVIGPMCAINRVSSEPPSHRECAAFAAIACPFMVRPAAKRREANLPDHHEAAGIGLKRNPGVTLVWITRSYKAFRPPGGGVLFEIGDPIETLWFSQGRRAAADEVIASFTSGCPLLEGEAIREGASAHAAYLRMRETAMRFIPAA